MKKYTTLPTDCTTLATEVMAYLNSTGDLEDIEHQTNAFRIIPKAELANTSIDTTFPGFTSKDFMHCTVFHQAMFNHAWDHPCILIPLADCDSTVLKIFDVAPGAVLQPTTSYLDEDCTLIDTIPLTGPIVIGANTAFTIESADTLKLSDALMVWFEEDINPLLA